MRDVLTASMRQTKNTHERGEGIAMEDRLRRRQGVNVIVNLSTEPIDFDAWAAKYVQAAIAVDRAQQQQHAEAA
jgi:hypothetical protein